MVRGGSRESSARIIRQQGTLGMGRSCRSLRGRFVVFVCRLSKKIQPSLLVQRWLDLQSCRSSTRDSASKGKLQSKLNQAWKVDSARHDPEVLVSGPGSWIKLTRS